jgi:hypothetical protein
MADLPDGIDLARHRDFEGREPGKWVRRAFLLLLTVFLVAGLLNVFGQSPTTSSAEGSGGSLTVSAPGRIRGGLLYQAKFTIRASEPLAAPTLVLDRGWFENTTVNTVEPEPVGSTSDPDHVKLRFAPMPPGRELVVYMDFQVNPTNVGSHDAGAALYDADRPIAAVDREQIDFP